MSTPFTGLPRPDRDHLSLYVIGSGFGESSVVVLPRGGTSRTPVIVVDTCVDGDAHLTLGLLKELGISRIDLLLVTHSDLDHVRGLPALVDGAAIVEAWRFPGAGDVRTLASKWLRGRPTDQRLKELAAAMSRLDELADANSGSRGALESEAWDDHVRTLPDETWAVIAPFKHGGVTLPDTEVLRNLHGRGVRLAMCYAAPTKEAVSAAGWTPDGSVEEVCAGPLIALSWSPAGACSAARGKRAAIYTAKALARPRARRPTARGR